MATFEWIDAKKTLPEEVMEHIPTGGDLCTKVTRPVLVRYESAHGEPLIIMGYRAYSLVKLTRNDGSKRNGWYWSATMHSPEGYFRLEDQNVTHWAYIPDVE